jgi:hypothetical protein
MPTTEPGSRRLNHLKSIYKYLREQIILPMGIPIYYMGMERRGDMPAAWGEADVLPLAAIAPMRNMGDGAFSIYLEMLLNMNFYAPTQSGTTHVGLYSLVAKVDQIVDKFDIGVMIPVCDFDAPGDPEVAVLEAREKPSVRDVPTAPDLAVDHINVGVLLRHHAVTIR